MNPKPKVLVICSGNSMRSQMAEGLLRADLGDTIDVYSAGIQPSFVHPAIVAVLHDIGIDISHHRSKSVSEFVDQRLDLVITVCDHAADRCPEFPYARRTVHKAYPVPTGGGGREEDTDPLVQMRDQMRTELRELVVKELNL